MWKETCYKQRKLKEGIEKRVAINEEYMEKISRRRLERDKVRE